MAYLAVIDGAYALPGKENFEINAGRILFPRSENLRIVSIEPQEIEFTFKTKS